MNAIELPAGSRTYAFGDIHGCHNLMKAMLDAVMHDVQKRPPDAGYQILFLGDLIDRGPDSYAVIDAIIRYQASGLPLQSILGNHDDWMLQTLLGYDDHLPYWWMFGGVETIASYGVATGAVPEDGPDHEAIAAFRKAVPDSHYRLLM
jgi:serine/threonine protein phosphatase 1